MVNKVHRFWWRYRVWFWVLGGVALFCAVVSGPVYLGDIAEEHHERSVVTVIQHGARTYSMWLVGEDESLVIEENTNICQYGCRFVVDIPSHGRMRVEYDSNMFGRVVPGSGVVHLRSPANIIVANGVPAKNQPVQHSIVLATDSMLFP